MTPEEIAAMKAENDKLKSEKAERDNQLQKDKEAADKLKKDKEEADKTQGDDLRDKVRKEKEAQDKSQSEARAIEKALKFNLSLPSLLTESADVLPSEIQEIVKQADKEKYDSAAQRAGVVQASIIQSFFSVQDNLDLLTASQKVTLDDYLKLTKNGKEQKAETIFENLFEPALATLKKVKKAEELGKARSGFSSGNKMEDDYKKRLIAGSQAKYLNKKGTK